MFTVCVSWGLTPTSSISSEVSLPRVPVAGDRLINPKIEHGRFVVDEVVFWIDRITENVTVYAITHKER